MSYIPCTGPASRIIRPAEAVFRECLKRERGQVLYAGEGGETVGYALIHGGQPVPALRGSPGTGTGDTAPPCSRLPKRASGRRGRTACLLGRGRYYLLQGVPAEDPAVPAFFERRAMPRRGPA